MRSPDTAGLAWWACTGAGAGYRCESSTSVSMRLSRVASIRVFNPANYSTYVISQQYPNQAGEHIRKCRNEFMRIIPAASCGVDRRL